MVKGKPWVTSRKTKGGSIWSWRIGRQVYLQAFIPTGGAIILDPNDPNTVVYTSSGSVFPDGTTGAPRWMWFEY